jgi:FAD/FMN-containing dehydrogenase
MSGPAGPNAQAGTTNADYRQSHAMPASAAELSALVKAAAQDGIAIVTGAPGRIPAEAKKSDIIFCDLSKMNRVLEHETADQVIQVESGITISDLNDKLAAQKQFLPLRVPKNWTLLDAVNRGETGTLEHGYGSMRDLVLGCSVIMSDGSAIKCGGRVVKNVTGYDVTKLVVGSHGWLGIPTAVHLRLYALPESSVTLVWSFDSLWKLMNCALSLLKSGLPLAALEAVHNDKPGAAVSKFILLGQIFGIESVKDEIAQSARQLIGTPQTELHGTDEQVIWGDIAEFFLAGGETATISIVAPPVMLPDIVAGLPFGSRWQMRPSKGRITAVCRDAEEALRALERVSATADATIVVAHADSRYNVKVRYFPAQDNAAQKLKLRIKQELDPTATLNPYVIL